MKGSVAVEIVERIAAREGVDPLELDPNLYEAIEADALDALVQQTDSRRDETNVRVEFTYCGYAVTVTGTEEVTIEKQWG